MLDPAGGAKLARELIPAVLRGGGEFAIDGLRAVLDFLQIGQAHHSSTAPSMQVQDAPPIQISPLASRSTCTRPARPSALP